MKKLILMMSMLSMISTINANPSVIGVIGQTVPIQAVLPHVPVINIKSINDSSLMDVHIPTHVSLSIFPVVSKSLSVGEVENKSVNYPHIKSPLFILGADQVSTLWLKQYQNKLVKLHAIGFVVNVKNQQSYNALKALSPKLSLLPVNGDQFHKRFGIKHYPVLISSHYIEQKG